MDGRYDSITTSPAPDCDQSAARDGRSHGGTPHDGGHDEHRPESDYQVGYGGTASTQRQSPSYVEERDRYHVDGQYVGLGLVCFGDGQRPGVATSTSTPPRSFIICGLIFTPPKTTAALVGMYLL